MITRLELVNPADVAGFAVLKQGTGDPVLRGIDTDGITYECATCSAVLAEDLLEQVWDLAFRCHRCGEVSRSPSLPPGRPLPRGTMMYPPGEYLLNGSLYVRELVQAGQAAVERRQAETSGPQIDRPNELTDAYLDALADEVERLLGVERFAKLDRAYRRGRKSATPPKVISLKV